MQQSINQSLKIWPEDGSVGNYAATQAWQRGLSCWEVKRESSVLREQLKTYLKIFYKERHRCSKQILRERTMPWEGMGILLCEGSYEFLLHALSMWKLTGHFTVSLGNKCSSAICVAWDWPLRLGSKRSYQTSQVTRARGVTVLKSAEFGFLSLQIELFYEALECL